MLIVQQILLWYLLLTTLCIVQFISNLCLFSAWLAAEEVDLWSVLRRSVFLGYWFSLWEVGLWFCFFSNFVMYHIPKEELAKFGYRSERKVVIYLWLAGIYCLLENFPFGNLLTLLHSFHKNCLHELHWICICHQVQKFAQERKDSSGKWGERQKDNRK
jgi:hypothetical protein